MSIATAQTALALAAFADAVAALAHVGCIVFGAAWYRFFGAGERMARMAERGDPRAAIVTAGIVVMLLAWTAVALSGAGAIPRLPWLREALYAIAAVLLLRGVAGVAIAVSGAFPRRAFWWWSSGICLAMGALHAMGAVATKGGA